MSADWALGADVQYAHAWNRSDAGTDAPTWGSAWFGLGVSATYN